MDEGTPNQKTTHAHRRCAKCKSSALISLNVFRNYYSIVCLSLFVFDVFAPIPPHTNSRSWFETMDGTLFAVTFVMTNKYTFVNEKRKKWNEGEWKTNGIVCTSRDETQRRSQRFNIKRKIFTSFCGFVDSQTLDFWRSEQHMHTQQTNFVWVVVISFSWWFLFCSST